MVDLSRVQARSAGAPSPFDPDEGRAYRRWREWKLAGYPRDVAELVVPVADPHRLSGAERQAVLDRCRRANMAVYQLAGPADKGAIAALGHQFGLDHLDGNLWSDEDSITSLRVSGQGRRKGEYIPYTPQRLNWHTDGYYNTEAQRVRAFILHCVRPAASGGMNGLLDHEIAYILLRDANPDFIRALMAPDAMTIPANVEGGVEIRPARSGPVFLVEPETGNLYMRYSARLRNVVWHDDPVTRAAAAFLQDLWENGCEFAYHHRLVPGQGVICNNVLHSRTAFEDAEGSGRLLYRARYLERIRGTDFRTVYPG